MTGHDYFRALLEVATVINSSLEPTVVLHKITEQTAKAMNCKASTLRLLDRTGKLLLASAAWGLSSGYMRKGPVEVAKSGLDGEVLKGKLIHLRDACSDGRFQYPESAKAEGLVSVLQSHRHPARLFQRRARFHPGRMRFHARRSEHFRHSH